MGLPEVEAAGAASALIVAVTFVAVDVGVHRVKVGEMSHLNWILRSSDDGYYSLTNFQFLS